MRKTIIEHVAEHAICQPNKVAIVVKKVETSYCELFHLVRGYSSFLKNMGINESDIIVVKASQSLEYVVSYLAIHLCHAIVAPIERNAPFEVVYETAKKVNSRMIIGRNFVFCDNQLEKHDIINTAKAFFRIGEEYTFPKLEDTADILFTTGTTGIPKGVELTHMALVATAENLILGCKYKKDTVMVVPGPLNHANAIRKLFTSLINGSTIYILNGMMNLSEFYDALDYKKGKIACCLPPAALRKIFQRSGDKLGNYADVIDFIESATSPLPESDKKKLCFLLPNTRLYNNYGSSEAGSVCIFDYNSERGLENCVGKPMINSKVIIVDQNRRPIMSSKENIGYISCSGDTNMRGYVNDIDATNSVLVNGIIYTNDIGYIDNNGYVYILGRKDDIINVGGFKVSPSEVESVVLEYDGIGDCICIGVSDLTYGKVLKLLYVLDKSKRFNLEDFKKFLIKKLESDKIPSYFEEVYTIKKTYNGKKDRKFYF